MQLNCSLRKHEKLHNIINRKQFDNKENYQMLIHVLEKKKNADNKYLVLNFWIYFPKILYFTKYLFIYLFIYSTTSISFW